MTEYKHDKYGVCEFVELTQGQLEKFHKEMKDMNSDPNPPVTVWRGNSVRACAKLGLIIEPEMTVEDVDSASPGLIRWLSDKIGEWQREALDIDPLP